MGLFGNPEAKLLFKQAVALRNDKKFYDALTILDEAIKLDSKDSKLWYQKAVTLLDVLNLNEALTCIDQSIKFKPKNIFEILLDKSLILFKLGKLEETLSCLDEAKKVKQGYNENKWVLLRNHQSLVYFVMKQYEKSLECAFESLSLKPYNPELLRQNAYSLLELKQFESAIKSIDEAIKQDPNGEFTNGNKQDILNKIAIAQQPSVEGGWSMDRSTQGAYSHFDEMSQESNDDLQESDMSNNFSRLAWKDAENLVGKLFGKKGYSVQVTGKSGDFGIDVEASKGTEFIGIQVKHWSMDVGFEDVAKTFGVANKYTRVIIVSTKSGFTSQAMLFARRDENRYRLELWNGQRFKQELRQFVIER